MKSAQPAEEREEVILREAFQRPQGALFRPTAFSADGSVIASCNVHRALHLWRAPSWADIEAAEAKQKGEGRTE